MNPLMPPPPPEADNLNPSRLDLPPLMPDADDVPAPPNQPLAAPLTAMPPVPSALPPAPSADSGQGCMTCLQIAGVGGIGCLVVTVLLLIGVVLVGGMAVSDLVNGLSTLVSDPLGFLQRGANVNEPDSIYVPPVEPIQELSELTTIRRSYADIFTSSTDLPAALAPLYGESLVLVAVGHIDAGLDLSDFSQDNLILDREMRTLTIQLPEPRLQNCFLNDRESYVAQRNQALFASPSRLIDTQSRRFALQTFRDRALEEGILNEARTRSQTVIQTVVDGLVNSVLPEDERLTIVVTFIQTETEPPLVETCQ